MVARTAANKRSQRPVCKRIGGTFEMTSLAGWSHSRMSSSRRCREFLVATAFPVQEGSAVSQSRQFDGGVEQLFHAARIDGPQRNLQG